MPHRGVHILLDGLRVSMDMGMVHHPSDTVPYWHVRGRHVCAPMWVQRRAQGMTQMIPEALEHTPCSAPNPVLSQPRSNAPAAGGACYLSRVSVPNGLSVPNGQRHVAQAPMPTPRAAASFRPAQLPPPPAAWHAVPQGHTPRTSERQPTTAVAAGRIMPSLQRAWPMACKEQPESTRPPSSAKGRTSRCAKGY